MASRFTRAAPEASKPLFENDRVRLFEHNVKGTRVGMHTHQDYFTYAFTPFDYKSASGGGVAPLQRDIIMEQAKD